MTISKLLDSPALSAAKIHVHPTIAVQSRPILYATWMQIGVIATLIVMLWLTIGTHLFEVRSNTERNAAVDTRNLAHAAEQSINGMIAGVDQMLVFARTALAAEPQLFDVDNWMVGGRDDWGGYLLGIIDRYGMLRRNRHTPTTASFDLSDRSYFRAHMTNPIDMLIISEPLILRSSGKWSVQFSRRLDAADGSFDGVMVLSLEPSWLTRMYGELEIGRGALIVAGTDGIMRARAPAAGLGQDIHSSEMIQRAMVSDRGSYRAVSQVTGIDQFISFQRLPDYPLIVAVALNAREVLAPYYQEQVKYLISGAALTILILLVGAGVVIQNLRLIRSRQVLSAAVNNIRQGLMMIDENRQLPLISDRAIELLSIPPALLASTPSYDDLVDWQMKSGEFGAGTEDGTGNAPLPDPTMSDLRNGDYERIRPNGMALEVRTQLLPGGGAMLTFTDITDRKRSEALILHQAHHDELTGLPNRVLLNDRLSQALNLAASADGALALLAIDIDHFKMMNDRFGQAACDRLLVLVANRLQDAIHPTGTVARVGGDQFIILQTDRGQPVAAGELALRLHGLLSEPFSLDSKNLGVGTQASVSIGIALYPADADNAEALLSNANTALSRAKANLRGSFCYFEAQMDGQLRERWALEQDLRVAIGTAQLRVHYQPIFASATRTITGFEALLRWQHPVRGNIPPMAFVPIAEESGMIAAIGAWVLEEACRTAVAWAEPKRLAVNLSAVQLRSDDLPTRVAEILRRTGLPSRLLELEVTETMLVNNHEAALATLQKLRDQGVQIACDDFGTGYSSFLYLQNLAFDRIKIDKSFVQELGVSASALRIVQAILAMAKSLGMEVTAEGVETELQFAILRDHGCDEIQGFLLGKPVSGDEVPRLVRDARSTVAGRAPTEPADQPPPP